VTVPTDYAGVWKLLYDWQTLLTGVAALVAAWWTVRQIRSQIRQTEELATDQRRRRERAARAMLPLALSELADYAAACMTRLHALRPYFRPDGSLDSTQADKAGADWTTPALPQNVLAVVKECIEFVDDGPARTLAVLIRQFQVQHVRLNDGISRLRRHDGVRLILWAHVQQAIRDAAEVYGRTSAAFPFARGEAIQQFDDRHVTNALYAAGCFDSSQIDTLTNEWRREFQMREELGHDRAVK
jgi:hypothetical protein